jgi:hypothetical protein
MLFVNSYAYVCLVGLLLAVASLRGVNRDAALGEWVLRSCGVLIGLAIIVAGIWLNLR